MRTGLKLVLMGGLLLVLMIPILSLRGLVWERQQRGMAAAEDIARSSSRDQQIVGPLLLVEAEETVRRTRTKRHGDGSDEVLQEAVRQKRQYLFAPDTLVIDNQLTARERRRGLFGALLYANQLNATARFSLLVPPLIEGDLVAHRWLSASVVMGVGDARGIQRLSWVVDGRELRVEPGSQVGFLAEGVHVPVDISSWPEAHSSEAGLRPESGRTLELVIDAQIQGTQSLQWSPLAGEARVSARADWPHPSFQGQRLPDDPVVEPMGFAATWSVSRLSSQSLQALSRCEVTATHCSAVGDAAFGMRLVDPVDRYLKTERAIKYALLLLVLVFGAVFFLEALRGVEVHPLQYGLTGIALAMFFLLLLSLSEHIGFGPAYAVAATACVALIGTYMSAVLGGMRRGVLFGALVAGLYGLLYGLLQSEDYALLMGSLALFALLACVMLATRRLDWRRVGQRA